MLRIEPLYGVSTKGFNRGRKAIMTRLSAKARALLLDIYRGKITAMPSDGIGEYHHADGDWRRAHESTPMGQAWSDLAKAGLIDDYDCFGGFNYCHISKAGERLAEEQIAKATAVRMGRGQ